MRGLSLVTAVLMVIGSEGFVPTGATKCSCTSISSMELAALWRHWIPEECKADFLRDVDDRDDNSGKVQRRREIEADANNLFLASLVALAMVLVPASGVHAVSGGGLDFAGLDITGQDFSNNNYKGKDFTQVIAKGTNFANSNLQGCRFYKSYLVNTDFSGADITGGKWSFSFSTTSRKEFLEHDLIFYVGSLFGRHKYGWSVTEEYSGSRLLF